MNIKKNDNVRIPVGLFSVQTRGYVILHGVASMDGVDGVYIFAVNIARLASWSV